MSTRRGTGSLMWDSGSPSGPKESAARPAASHSSEEGEDVELGQALAQDPRHQAPPPTGRAHASGEWGPPSASDARPSRPLVWIGAEPRGVPRSQRETDAGWRAKPSGIDEGGMLPPAVAREIAAGPPPRFLLLGPGATIASGIRRPLPSVVALRPNPGGADAGRRTPRPVDCAWAGGPRSKQECPQFVRRPRDRARP